MHAIWVCLCIRFQLTVTKGLVTIDENKKITSMAYKLRI